VQSDRSSAASPARSAAGTGLTIGGTIIRYGEQAPRGGSGRASWCLFHGLEELRKARRDYGIALRLLIEVLPGGIGSLPEPYPLQSPHPRALGYTVGTRRVRQWFSLRKSFDERQEALDDPWRIRMETRLADAEGHARHALQAICNAYNFFDDITYDYPNALVEVSVGKTKRLVELIDDCHTMVHRFGELVGGFFGCEIEEANGVWFDRCLVSLLHLRFGNSTGFTARYVCVVCGADAGDCDHRLGQSYSKIAGLTNDGNCNICGERCEAHVAGNTYEVPASYRITDIEVQEVSLVNRPRDPLTRIEKRSLDPRMLADHLGRPPEPGERVLDHACMFPCGGFSHYGVPQSRTTRPIAGVRTPSPHKLEA